MTDRERTETVEKVQDMEEISGDADEAMPEMLPIGGEPEEAAKSGDTPPPQPTVPGDDRARNVPTGGVTGVRPASA